MNTMTPTRPAGLHACRVHLTTRPAAAAEARSQVRTAGCTRDAAAGPTVLLTSRLVPSVIRHEAGETLYCTLALQPHLAKGCRRGPGRMP